MSNKKVSGDLFKKMVINGAIHLKNNHKEVDHLNVFPVPDGDTGTNMSMTVMAGIKEVNSLNSRSIVDVSKILSRGLLMGARGNSGVILSQFFRGVYSEISKINSESVSIKEFIQALVGGYQMAYRAVMDPVEGTILTVVRESAETVLRQQASLTSIEDVLKVYLDQAKQTLIKTPELLPVLKEAGVVDSGGAGFIKIVEGMLMALEGKYLNEINIPTVEQSLDNPYNIGAHNLGEVEIKYGYCTEFIVQLYDPSKFDTNDVREPLEQMGDSLVVVCDEDLLKVHVHTNQPGVAITLAQKFGELKTTKIENMRTQNNNLMNEPSAHDHTNLVHAKQQEEKPRAKFGIIAVAQGDGIKEALKELGVDIIIDGGQTMNPATDEFVKAVEKVNAENIIILPNNSNVILSAEQAAKLVEDHFVVVLKSKSVAQGYASLMAFDPTTTLEENVEMMSEIITNMKSAEVTYAVRDTEMNGVRVTSGDFIGIAKSKLLVSTPNRLETTSQLLDQLIDDESEIVTIFYGSDVKDEEIAKLTEYVAEHHPNIELETIDGNQDVYSYIIAVE